MDVYRTEEEQAEALRKWWEENGKSIIAGIVIGLSTIYGWRAWQDHVHARAEAASSEYQQMIVAARQGETAAAREHAQTILGDYNATGYAQFAELLLARIAVDGKDYAGAEEHLRRVMAKTSSDQIRHIARLRLARLLLTQDRFDEVETLLNITDRGEFLADYEELRGDLFFRQDRKEEAKNAYELALTNTKSGEQDRSILQMKIDQLGDQ